MRFALATALTLCGAVALCAPAWADTQPTARDIQAAVDGYLAGGPEAQLVGGPGSAGYDSGFWIRGGDFSLKINLTLQARYEWFDWDEDQPPEAFTGSSSGGDLSGFSLPRATLKFSGTAPCNICYYMELEFGHFGRDFLEDERGSNIDGNFSPGQNLGPWDQSYNYDNTREAWIEWCYCPSFNLRMGQIKTPNTRQLMVSPEQQQFVDISLASICTGWSMPGYTDRNRDHGVMAHGAFGCDSEWSYMFAVTNGDGGDSIRNVLDPRTSDNLAFSGRLNWAFLNKIGYTEGALNFDTCSWYGEVGVWAYYYADRTDKSHTAWQDSLRWGLDLALGYGGFSLTAAYTLITDSDSDFFVDYDETDVLVQLGYHFPGTAWEVAARWAWCDWEFDGSSEGSVTELAFGVNYYLNGHGNKLQLDVSFYEGDDFGSLPFDFYAGLPNNASSSFGDTYGMLLRFQWQLAL